MKHTSEPWAAIRDPSHFDSLSSIVGGQLTGMWRSVAEVTGKDACEQEANTLRIVACVNACAGIADPTDLRKQRDELLEACRKANTCASIPDYVRDVIRAAIAIATAQPKE